MVSDFENTDEKESVEDTEIMDSPPIDAFNRALAKDPNKLPTVTYVFDPEQAEKYGVDAASLESSTVDYGAVNDPTLVEQGTVEDPTIVEQGTVEDPTFVGLGTVEDPTFVEQIPEPSSPPTLERVYLEQPEFEEPPISSGSTGGFAPTPDPSAMPVELNNINFGGPQRGVWKGRSPAVRRLVVVASGLVIGVLLTIAMSKQSPQTLPPIPVANDGNSTSGTNIAAVIADPITENAPSNAQAVIDPSTSDTEPVQVAAVNEKEPTEVVAPTEETTDVGLADPIVVAVVDDSAPSSAEALAGLSDEELAAEIATSEQLAKLQDGVAEPQKSQLQIIRDYVSGKKPVISAREFMYISDKLRSFNPDFVAPNQPKTKSGNGNGQVPVLRAVPNSNGRFNSGDGSADWQGNFNLNNPGQNIEVGKAYQQYLKDIVGSSNTSSGIVSRQTGGTNLLKNSVGAGRGPTGTLNYSP